MKTVFPFLLLTFLLLLALMAQDLVVPASFLGQAKLLFVPLVFCFGALALPFPQALLFAVVTALLEGLMVMRITNDHVDIRLGWFFFFFIVWTVLLQFVSDLTHGIRWEVHALGSGLCTASFLLGTFLLVSFDRAHFFMRPITLFLIIVPSGAAVFLAPLCYATLQFLLPPAQAGRGARAASFANT